jgi:copper chaperone CopZ
MSCRSQIFDLNPRLSASVRVSTSIVAKAAVLLALTTGSAMAAPKRPAVRPKPPARVILHILQFEREDAVPETTRVLTTIKGVLSARVDLRSATATICYDTARARTADFIAALERIGYRSIEDGPDRWPPKPEKIKSC